MSSKKEYYALNTYGKYHVLLQITDPEVPPAHRTLNLLCRYIGVRADKAREKMPAWVETHMDWVKKVTSNLLEKKNRTFENFLSEWLHGSFPLDEAGILIIARAYKIHVAVFFNDHYWITHAGNDINKCKVFLVYRSNLVFVDSRRLMSKEYDERRPLMEKLRKYYVTPEKDKALERHKIHAAKRLLKLKASDIDENHSNDSSSSSSSSSSSRSSDDIMPKRKNGNIMPSAPSSSSPSNGQQMDLEDIMNDDDSAKSPEHVENSTSPAAPSEKDDTAKSPEPVGQVENITPAAAPSENDDSTSTSESQSSEETDSSSEEISYICSTPKCGLVFDNAKELKDHSRKHRVKRSLDGHIHCDVHGCKNHYGTKRALQRHKKNNHDTSGTRYYCTEKVGRRKACDKSYPTEQQLNQHIRGIHGDGFIAYCGKSFTWPLGHHRHQKKCTKCKKLIEG